MHELRSVPDLAAVTRQVRDTLGALAERFAALRIDGGQLHASRLARTPGGGNGSRGLALKRIVMYSPNWVRSQNRMSSTSNQARRLPNLPLVLVCLRLPCPSTSSLCSSPLTCLPSHPLHACFPRINWLLCFHALCDSRRWCRRGMGWPSSVLTQCCLNRRVA
jgi:hypothetical protein